MRLWIADYILGLFHIVLYTGAISIQVFEEKEVKWEAMFVVRR